LSTNANWSMSAPVVWLTGRVTELPPVVGAADPKPRPAREMDMLCEGAPKTTGPMPLPDLGAASLERGDVPLAFTAATL
jgi:hypothetical protein